MRQKIDREAYLQHANAFSSGELALIREFGEWLPDRIIDCHAHCNLPEHVKAVGEQAYAHMLSTFPSFTLEESMKWQTLLHPRTYIRTLRFATVFQGIDHRAANAYLLNQSRSEDRVALYGLPDDQPYTIAMLAHPRVSALKMYYSYLEPPATEIRQYFPSVVLEVAQDREIPIILHPPCVITKCLNQILELVHDFPRLRICIAHLGMTKRVVPDLEMAYATLAQFDRIYFDTALVPSEEVVLLALRTVGSDRVMYGSDEPLHLIRSVAYHNPTLGQRIVTEYPYHWVDPVEHETFKHLALGTTHAHWASLLAIRSAVNRLQKGEEKKLKQQIFYANAASFYGF